MLEARDIMRGWCGGAAVIACLAVSAAVPAGSAGGSPACSTGVPPVNHGQDGRATVKAPATAQPDAVQTPSPSVPTVSPSPDTARSGNGAPGLLPPNDPRQACKVELLAIARKLAKDGKTSTILRISAVAAIGTLGDATDRPMLDEMAKGGEHRLHAAATTALKKL